MGGHSYVPAVFRSMILRDLGIATGLGIGGGLLWRMYQKRVEKCVTVWGAFECYGELTRARHGSRTADYYKQFNKACCYVVVFCASFSHWLTWVGVQQLQEANKH